ncbi:MAG: hypothetical protein M1830_005575 [Pleopsidium flavum]|nr:MAG: hypothetical protein M1830_005575 [Pleopsidium flavum]
MEASRASLEQSTTDIRLLPVTNVTRSPKFDCDSADINVASGDLDHSGTSTGPAVNGPVPAVKGWPEGPRQIVKHGFIYDLTVIWDAFITCLPVIFIVLGACALALDKKPIFSNILVGSQSFAGAVQQIVGLRIFSLGAISIILLWAFSPLGGQSSLRLLTRQESALYGSKRLWYLNTNGTSGFAGSSTTASSAAPVTALYAASLLAPLSVTNSPMDTWQNVRIPLLEALPRIPNEDGDGSWLPVEQSANITYSSLNGLPIAGLPSEGDATFSVDSSYFALNCSLVRLNISSPDILGNARYHTNHSTWDSILHGSPNYASGLGDHVWNSFFVDYYAPLPTSSAYTTSYWHLVFGSRNLAGMKVFNCSMGTTRVESSILCQGSSCHVNKMRRSQVDARPSTSTPFNDPDTNSENSWVTLNNLVSLFPYAAGVTHVGVANPAENFLVDNSSTYTSDNYNVDYRPVSPEAFSHRLIMLFNTYWQLSLATYSTAGDKVMTKALDRNGQMRDLLSGLYPSNLTTAETTIPVTIYHANRSWIGLLLMILLILQLCAIAGVILKYTTTAPDILGYVSTMTRDNPYTPLPDGGQTLDGMERARLLGNMHVQIADVNQGKDYGHIAFSSVTEGNRLARLYKRRWYI